MSRFLPAASKRRQQLGRGVQLFARPAVGPGGGGSIREHGPNIKGFTGIPVDVPAQPARFRGDPRPGGSKT